MARKKLKFNSQWAETKKVCRLNMEDIRMAKELGMSPQSLKKNQPSESQRWKQPVKDWIHGVYEKRFGSKTTMSGANAQPNETSETNLAAGK